MCASKVVKMRLVGRSEVKERERRFLEKGKEYSDE